jgi:hypothetical protein
MTVVIVALLACILITLLALLAVAVHQGRQQAGDLRRQRRFSAALIVVGLVDTAKRAIGRPGRATAQADAMKQRQQARAREEAIQRLWLEHARAASIAWQPCPLPGMIEQGQQSQQPSTRVPGRMLAPRGVRGAGRMTLSLTAY